MEPERREGQERGWIEGMSVRLKAIMYATEEGICTTCDMCLSIKQSVAPATWLITANCTYHILQITAEIHPLYERLHSQTDMVSDYR